ncbi:BTAD domain-containing putative transcriptional regulator [Amycolatopsis sp. NPDC052450]|uniref:AfsR/SARP family transcriptional regulator n=1 Tax=Amycolatopsis sp. NPDC052450 TaxID=3363937 RepID=UPI0037C59C46
MTIGDGRREDAPSSNKEKQLLSLLLLNRPNITSTDMIIGELWPESAPRSAMATLQTYIAHLRQFLANLTEESPDVVSSTYLVHRARGYLIGFDDLGLDITAYRAIERRVYRNMDEKDYAEAVRECDAALALWRGSALVDVRAGQYVQAEIEGLEQSRMSVTEIRIEAELALGRDHKVLGELSKMVAMHPLHEGLSYKYMRALANSGYRVRALEIYRKLHRAMVEQLGVEPALGLRRLHNSILNEDDQYRSAG